jgi:hypothetical protein
MIVCIEQIIYFTENVKSFEVVLNLAVGKEIAGYRFGVCGIAIDL